jgi:hypothetical protein
VVEEHNIPRVEVDKRTSLEVFRSYTLQQVVDNRHLEVMAPNIQPEDADKYIRSEDLELPLFLVEERKSVIQGVIDTLSS